MPRLEDLELCIELIESAATAEEAFGYFCAILETSGYDRITYSLATDHPSLGLPKQHGLATNYPDDWMAYYRSHDYMRFDPVVHQVLSSGKPFFWADLLANPELPAQSRLLMNQAAEAGLNDGVGISLAGCSGEVAGIGLARSRAAQDGKDYDFLARVFLLSTYFHETYRDMLTRQLNQVPPLTARERDVLLWAAEGKTDQEIAMILGISFHTVRFHWRHIFALLNVNGRSYAITKAIRLGLIAPEIVRSPYQCW